MLENLDKEQLIKLVEKLEKENKELKEKVYGKVEEKESHKEVKTISNEDKVKIFMEVFKGRTDLYAKRWTSNKTGKSGYSPVCKNEFSTYKCDKHSFEKVLKAVRSKYVYGLTATPTRKDGWHKIIYMQCGYIRVRVSHRELKQDKEMEHTVIVKKTNYKYIPTEEKDKIQISEILNDMCHNPSRNSMIIEDIKKCLLEGRVPIVLTERVEHLKILKESLEDLEVPVVVYKGNMGKKKTKEIQDVIDEADRNNKPRIILATSSSIGEGFDDGRLDTLFLTMPVSWKGRIIQYVGRLHREHENKEKVIVYDYLDNMKVLEKMYNRRLKGYKIAGYEIIE